MKNANHLIYDPNIVDFVRSSTPHNWVQRFMNTFISSVDSDLAIHMRYFVSDNVKVVVPQVPGPTAPNQVPSEVYEEYKNAGRLDDILSWKETVTRTGKKPYYKVYREYAQSQKGLLDFFENMKNFEECPVFSPSKSPQYDLKILRMKECKGMRSNYTCMDKAIVYIWYWIVSGTLGGPTFEVCDKLVIDDCKIVEYHHRPNLQPIIWKEITIEPQSDFDIIQEFETGLGAGDLSKVMKCISHDFTFRTYFTNTPKVQPDVWTPPNTNDRDGFQRWLFCYIRTLRPTAHSFQQRVDGNRVYVTAKGIWNPAEINREAYYDIHNFKLSGPASDPDTKITNLVWHVDWNPLL